MRRTTSWSLLILVSFAALAGAGCRPGSDPKLNPKAQAAVWKFENPLREVEEGEWAQYVLSDENSWQIEVASVERDFVLMHEQTRGSDVNELRDKNQKKFGRNHMMNGYQSAGWVVQRIYEDSVEVAGRRWPAICFEYLAPMHGVIRVWYTHEIPVYGLLKQVQVKPSGQETESLRLVNWSGRSEK